MPLAMSDIREFTVCISGGLGRSPVSVTDRVFLFLKRTNYRAFNRKKKKKKKKKKNMPGACKSVPFWENVPKDASRRAKKTPKVHQ